MTSSMPHSDTPAHSARWIMVGDMRGARLLHRPEPSGDEQHLEEVDRLDNHLIPHDRGGRPPSSGVREIDYQNADRDHDVMREQFAGEIVRWIEQMAQRHRITRVDLFFNAELLGAVRRAWPAHVAFELHEHRGDLAHLSAAELEHHQAIRQLDSMTTA